MTYNHLPTNEEMLNENTPFLTMMELDGDLISKIKLMEEEIKTFNDEMQSQLSNARTHFTKATDIGMADAYVEYSKAQIGRAYTKFNAFKERMDTYLALTADDSSING